MARKGFFEEPRAVQGDDMILIRPRRNPIFLVIGGVLLLGMLVMALIGKNLKNGDAIYPNVRVADIEIGGLTAAEARALVEQSMSVSYEVQTLEVYLPDRTLYFEPEKVNLVVDAEECIKEAMTYGRDRGVFWAVTQYIESGKSVYTIDPGTILTMDTDYIKSVIQQAADEIAIAPVSSSVSMDPEMTALTVQIGTTGRMLDTEDLYHEVCQAFMKGDFEPLTWEYETLDYGKISLTETRDSLENATKDAYYDAETKQIVPSVNGHTFDVEAVKKSAAGIEEGGIVKVPLEEIRPQMTTGKLTNQMFGQILEQRSSAYVNDPARTENLRLACEAINGTVLNPGEVFSFNAIVGERTEEKGYRLAASCDGEGESVDAVGGGVCQVASTIYYAALYMELPTVMREPHMNETAFVPAGCDAAVFWESGLDYQFRNNRENPIKIQANIDDGKVNIIFWGVKETENRVELSKPVTVETWNDEDVVEVDETKPVGYREQKQTACAGSKVVVTRSVFDGDGKLLREEELESTYQSRPNIYIVGPDQ